VVSTWALRDGYEFTPDTDFGETSQVHWMQNFRGSGVIRVTGVAWYRGSTGTPGPSRMSVWDANLGVRLWETFDPPDNGSVGWQEIDLSDTPIDALSFNTKIGVSAYGASGTHRTYGSQSGQLSGAIPVNVELQQGFRSLSEGDLMPNDVHTGTIQGLDARLVQINVAGATVIAENVEAELARWLREDGDHYEESRLPFIAGQAAGANEAAQANTTAITALQTDTTTLITRLSQAWADTIGSNTEGIPGFLTQWDAFYTQFVDITAPAVANLVEAVGTFTGISVFSYLAALIRFANGIDAPPQLADTTDWELVDETDFVDNLLWPVEGDVYRVTLSVFDPAGTSEPVGTETRHAYLGKWCPFNVQFSSEWHYFNTASADLALGGRMPGLGLILYRPGAGHVQAWRRTEAP
jgi:hypothetical protein